MLEIWSVSKLLTENTLNRCRYEVFSKPKNSERRTGIVLINRIKKMIWLIIKNHLKQLLMRKKNLIVALESIYMIIHNNRGKF